MALNRLGKNHEVVAMAEIDPFAIKSYEAIHGPTENLGDVSKLKIEDIPDHDLLTYGFPCQDLSMAGLRKGFQDGTRSSMLYECKRIIEAKKPKYLVLENVKGLVTKKFIKEFEEWIEYLTGQGYKTEWKVINAKDFDIPQNRERVFAVSWLVEGLDFKFPDPLPSTLKLRDLLDDEVDESFYLSDEKTAQFVINQNGILDLERQVLGTCHKHNDLSRSTRDRVYNEEKLCPTLTATMYKDAPKVLTGAIRGRYNSEGKIEQQLELRKDECTNTITTVEKDNVLVKVGDVKAKGLSESTGRVYSVNGIAPTVLTMQGGNTEPKILERDLRIRKLTPSECWRLMDLDGYEKAAQVVSKTQLYKQAGNSIVVKVIEKIFEELLKNES